MEKTAFDRAPTTTTAADEPATNFCRFLDLPAIIWSKAATPAFMMIWPIIMELEILKPMAWIQALKA